MYAKQQTTNDKAQSQVDKALHTLRTDPRYANMAKACGVKTESENAKEAGQVVSCYNVTSVRL